MDMDGVLVHEEQMVPGADRFLARLREAGIPFLVLTNNSIYTPRDLSARLSRTGLEVPPESIWTSALATGQFLADQRPNGTAFVIGESGLTTALHDAGYTLSELDPDYVVLGETRTYSFDRITSAIRPDLRRRALHRDQPRPDRADTGRPAARDRIRRRADLDRDRRPALLRRQAEPADDALGAARDRRPLRDDRDDRRPHGHRHRRRHRGRARDRPRPDRHQRRGHARPASRTCRA